MRKISIKLNSDSGRSFEKYRWLTFCGEDMDANAASADRRFRKLAVCVAAMTCLLIFLGYAVSGSGKTPAELLMRDDYGQKGRSVTVNASAVYGDEVIEKEMELTVKPALLAKEEAEELFDGCEEYITSEVLASYDVSADLALPVTYADGLVEISWHSDDPSRLADDGTVNMLEVPDLCPVRVSAVMNAGDFRREAVYVLTVRRGSAAASMDRRLDLLARELSEDDTGARLDLPDELDGMQIRWNFPEREVPLELLALGLFVLLALYFGRYDAEEKRAKRIASEFEYEIPSMTLQLILLLNAGLVVSAAFDELIEKNMDSGKPLYTALSSVREKSRGENLAFVNELYVFANTTGCRDFIRLSSLILDHSSRGSELADKLEKERSQLWSQRLSSAKKRTKEAETKLCLPLMLLLIVLVIISAAPALMTM